MNVVIPRATPHASRPTKNVNDLRFTAAQISGTSARGRGRSWRSGTKPPIANLDFDFDCDTDSDTEVHKKTRPSGRVFWLSTDVRH